MSARRIISDDISRQEWEAVARLVNAGKFDRATSSMAESLLIGFRSWNEGEFWHAKRRLKITVPK